MPPGRGRPKKDPNHTMFLMSGHPKIKELEFELDNLDPENRSVKIKQDELDRLEAMGSVDDQVQQYTESGGLMQNPELVLKAVNAEFSKYKDPDNKEHITKEQLSYYVDLARSAAINRMKLPDWLEEMMDRYVSNVASLPKWMERNKPEDIESFVSDYFVNEAGESTGFIEPLRYDILMEHWNGPLKDILDEVKKKKGPIVADKVREIKDGFKAVEDEKNYAEKLDKLEVALENMQKYRPILSSGNYADIETIVVERFKSIIRGFAKTEELARDGVDTDELNTIFRDLPDDVLSPQSYEVIANTVSGIHEEVKAKAAAASVTKTKRVVKRLEPTEKTSMEQDLQKAGVAMLAELSPEGAPALPQTESTGHLKILTGSKLTKLMDVMVKGEPLTEHDVIAELPIHESGLHKRQIEYELRTLVDNLIKNYDYEEDYAGKLVYDLMNGRYLTAIMKSKNLKANTQFMALIEEKLGAR